MMDTPTEDASDIDGVAHNLRRIAAMLQDRLAAALGVSRARRVETVAAMLENNVRRAPGYWIQLLLAMAIATLGLVLDSTAVVIGAMLVSPLMGPIVELGMGFAVGSSLLVLRATLRVALSVVFVVGGAALLTLLLPFHEITTEVSARTAPTVLDLLVAVFCALTAAYTTVRIGADTTAAAAGTAIGIALVPPLCATGFGIGIGNASVWSGAALLFTANLSGILLVAVLSFLGLGYNQVSAITIERDYLEHEISRTDRLAGRVHAVMQKAFGSRYGMAMRVLIPIVFLASVYAPLRRALNEVSWQIRVRAGVRSIVREEVKGAVQTSLTLDQHTVDLRVLTVGTPDAVSRLEPRLTARIAAIAGVTPTVTVVALPDMNALAVAAANETRRDAGAKPTPDAVRELATRAGAALRASWPGGPVGALTGWQLSVSEQGETRIAVRHLGEALGGSGEQLLARALALQLGQNISVVDVSMPLEPIASRSGDGPWLATALRLLDNVTGTDSVVACVTGPLRPRSATASSDRTVAAAFRASPLAASGRLFLAQGTQWSIRAARITCDGLRPDTAAATARKITGTPPNSSIR